MSRNLVLILGLIALAVRCWLCVSCHAPRIDAELAAGGAWAELDELQDRLEGGRECRGHSRER